MQNFCFMCQCNKQHWYSILLLSYELLYYEYNPSIIEQNIDYILENNIKTYITKFVHWFMQLLYDNCMQLIHNNKFSSNTSIITSIIIIIFSLSLISSISAFSNRFYRKSLKVASNSITGSSISNNTNRKLLQSSNFKTCLTRMFSSDSSNNNLDSKIDNNNNSGNSLQQIYDTMSSLSYHDIKEMINNDIKYSDNENIMSDDSSVTSIEDNHIIQRRSS